MNVRQHVRAFVAREILGISEESPLSDSADLLQQGLDSLGILRLTVFLEDQFRVRVPDDVVVPENVRTVDALVRLVESLR